MIPCGDMHQSFTDTLVKWIFSTTSPCLPIVLVLCCFYSLRCPRIIYLFRNLQVQNAQASCTSDPYRAEVPCDSTALLLQRLTAESRYTLQRAAPVPIKLPFS